MLPALPRSSVHWHLLTVTAPTCTPTDPNPFISPPLFHYAPGICSLNTSLWSHGARLSLNISCLPGTLGNPDIPARRGHLLHLPHGSHTMDPSGKLGPDPSPNMGNIIRPSAPSHPSQHHGFPLLSGYLTQEVSPGTSLWGLDMVEHLDSAVSPSPSNTGIMEQMNLGTRLMPCVFVSLCVYLKKIYIYFSKINSVDNVHWDFLGLSTAYQTKCHQDTHEGFRGS